MTSVIRATLAHLVNADHGYHRRLTGVELGPQLDKDIASLDAIRERFQVLATRWPALFDDPSAPDREIPTQYGTTRGAVVMAQPEPYWAGAPCCTHTPSTSRSS